MIGREKVEHGETLHFSTVIHSKHVSGTELEHGGNIAYFSGKGMPSLVMVP